MEAWLRRVLDGRIPPCVLPQGGNADLSSFMDQGVSIRATLGQEVSLPSGPVLLNIPVRTRKQGNRSRAEETSAWVVPPQSGGLSDSRTDGFLLIRYRLGKGHLVTIVLDDWRVLSLPLDLLEAAGVDHLALLDLLGQSEWRTRPGRAERERRWVASREARFLRISTVAGDNQVAHWVGRVGLGRSERLVA